jgi:Fe-S oxidoreductase
MKAIAPFKEAVDAVIEAGGDAFKLCYQCGICSGSCPWNLVRSFIVRKLMREIQFGLIDLESEELWRCVGCGLCVQRCPRGVDIIEIMKALRRIAVEWRAMPQSLRVAFASLGAVGNPWGEAREKRANWAKELGVKTFTKGTEWLYFPCCTPAYEPQAKEIATSTVKILNQAGIDFGILGVAEVCCGESARRLGDESLFQSLARTNITAFLENGVRKIITSSPHCYSAFKDDYPDFGVEFEVIHGTQFLAQLIKEGRLKLTKELNKRVVYHDPCCLGRLHNHNIYDEPREVLRSIPGAELIEFRDSRKDSLCCGGGCGGRIWVETPKGERLADIRVEQALEIGAEVLATACPYCILNLKDSVLTVGKGYLVEVKDISQLVAEAI